ncbi:hypothetical protein HOY82DRAFT_374278 [Tuber indicum]|nr:hypothetical protein HOY82DRAFT_374278 [Tuber indicum]
MLAKGISAFAPCVCRILRGALNAIAHPTRTMGLGVLRKSQIQALVQFVRVLLMMYGNSIMITNLAGTPVVASAQCHSPHMPSWGGG